MFMVQEILQKLGLSQSEAKVYLALIELGPSLAGDITKKANINRSNCYDALQRLTEKGLVSYVIKAQRKYFKAEEPNKLKNLLQEEKLNIAKKEKELNKILPELLSREKETQEKPFVALYHGKKGVKSIFEDILKYKEYWVFGSSGKLKESLGPYFELLQRRVKREKIKVRLLTGEKARSTDIVTHAETKYLPNQYTTLISTLVYGDKVAVISWTDTPVGFLMEDKQTANSYRKYFEFMWKQAKK